MKQVNYSGTSHYTLSKPMQINMDTAVTSSATACVQPAGIRPLVVITGRGKTAGRVANLVRLRPDVVADVKSLVDGPLYLTIELALRHYSNYIRARAMGDGAVEMIKASDLG